MTTETKRPPEPWRAYAASLWGSHEYKVVIEKVRSLAPVVPTFNHTGESNIETIKFELARKAMHDLILRILVPQGNDNE